MPLKALEAKKESPPKESPSKGNPPENGTLRRVAENAAKYDIIILFNYII